MSVQVSIVLAVQNPVQQSRNALNFPEKTGYSGQTLDFGGLLD